MIPARIGSQTDRVITIQAMKSIQHNYTGMVWLALNIIYMVIRIINQ